MQTDGDGVDNPVKEGDNYLVIPYDASLHEEYKFKVMVFLEGGAQKLFGPYTLSVGCLESDLQMSNSDQIQLNLNLEVGQTSGNDYDFKPPTSNRDWCQPVSHEVKMNVGTAKLVDKGPQPNTQFTVSTQEAGTTEFKIVTTFVNGIVKESPIVTILIECKSEEC